MCVYGSAISFLEDVGLHQVNFLSFDGKDYVCTNGNKNDIMLFSSYIFPVIIMTKPCNGNLINV